MWNDTMTTQRPSDVGKGAPGVQRIKHTAGERSVQAGSSHRVLAAGCQAPLASRSAMRCVQRGGTRPHPMIHRPLSARCSRFWRNCWSSSNQYNTVPIQCLNAPVCLSSTRCSGSWRACWSSRPAWCRQRGRSWVSQGGWITKGGRAVPWLLAGHWLLLCYRWLVRIMGGLVVFAGDWGMALSLIDCGQTRSVGG